MAGEHIIAKDLLQAAFQQARDDRGISEKTMTGGLLLVHGELSGRQTRKALDSMISF